MSLPNIARLISSPAPIGSIVLYKGVHHIIVDFNDDVTMVKILNPTVSNKKLQVLASNVSVTKYPRWVTVEYKCSKYLVPKQDSTIISLKTGRVIKWGNENGDRIAILTAVHNTYNTQVAIMPSS